MNNSKIEPMKLKNFIIATLIFCTQILFGQGRVNPNYHHVNGYVRKDGTYVKGYNRTNPNNTNRDNYSTQGNTNPWTGEPGYILPDNKRSENYGSPTLNPPISPSTKTYYSKSSSPSFPTTSQWNANEVFSKSEDEKMKISTNLNLDKVYNYTSNNTLTNPSSYIAGYKTINYRDGKEIFNVIATAKTNFKKQLTYYFYNPDEDKIMNAKGEAFGQLLDGEYKMLSDDGILISESNYKKGLRHGLHIEYNKQGKEESKIIYEEGELIYYKAVNDEGELVEWVGIPFKNNSIRTFTKNGMTTLKEEFKNKTTYKQISFNENNGKLVSEFNYINDELEGIFKSYHEDGKTIKRLGNILNHELHGVIKDYTESGNLISKTTFFEGKKNGNYEIYEDNGKIIEKGTFRDNFLDGLLEIHNYDKDFYEKTYYSLGKKNGNYEKSKGHDILIKGKYVNDEPDGKWNYFVKNKENPTPYIAAYFTYSNGIKNGLFRDVRNDSLIIGEYKNGLLEDSLKIYKPISLFLLGIIPQDIQETEIISEGLMFEGKKSGKWRNYDLTHTLTSEGQYLNDLEYGEWKYYFPKYIDENSNQLEYSGQLFLKENYLNGKLNGKVERFSSLEKTPILCDTSIGTVNPLDTCFKLNWNKQYDLTYYKNGILHGPIEIRDTGGILIKGNFILGKKNNLWTYKQENGIISTGNYYADQKNGKWQAIQDNRILNEVEYVNGKKEGISIDFDYFGKKLNQATFSDGNIKSVIKFDSISHKVLKTYENINYKNDSCYFKELYTSNDTIFSFHKRISTFLSNSKTEQFNFIYDVENQEGILHGTFFIKNAKGQPLITGDFFDGKKTNNWEYYNYIQGVRNTTIYVDGKRKYNFFKLISNGEYFSGVYQTFSNNGIIFSAIKVKDGLRHGKTKIYDKTGKLEKIKKYKKGLLIKGFED